MPCQARRSGASWTDIGRSMEVTKQAAQKRFVPKGPGEPSDLDPSQGFSRFTERARNVVMAAQNEARAADNDEIRPEHLVLGLLSEPDALAAGSIVAQGVPLGRCWNSKTARACSPASASTRRPPKPTSPPPWPPRAEVTLRECVGAEATEVGVQGGGALCGTGTHSARASSPRSRSAKVNVPVGWSFSPSR